MNGRDGETARLAAAYRDGFGLVPIAAIGGPHGIRIIIAEQADAPAAADQVQARWWCRRADDAREIAIAAAASLRRASTEAATAAAAASALARAAKRRHLDLWSDDEIAAHAADAIARVEAELAQLRASGGLRAVNTSYRAYRLETAARGERVVPYAQWMRRYKESLVRKLAATLRRI